MVTRSSRRVLVKAVTAEELGIPQNCPEGAHYKMGGVCCRNVLNSDTDSDWVITAGFHDEFNLEQRLTGSPCSVTSCLWIRWDETLVALGWRAALFCPTTSSFYSSFLCLSYLARPCCLLTVRPTGWIWPPRKREERQMYSSSLLSSFHTLVIWIEKKNTHKKKTNPRVDRDHCVSDCFLGAVVTGFNHLSEKSVAASAWINTVDVILE